MIPMDNIRPMNISLDVLSLLNCKTNPQGKKFVRDRLLHDLWAIAEGKTGVITPAGLQQGTEFFMVSRANAIPIRMMNEIVYNDDFKKPVLDGVKKATFREGIRIPTQFFDLPLKLASGEDRSRYGTSGVLRQSR